MSATQSQLSDEQYAEFRLFLERNCGIVLGENKQYLVSSRLARLMAEQNVRDLSDLLKRMQRFSERRLKQAVIDAMTTNETLWFRDTHPFSILRQRLLPELQAKRGDKIRIWSAACSSGQEPYSISMTVEEYKMASMGLLKNPVEIVATDLSHTVLEACRRAEYNRLSLSRGMSEERLKRFFEPAAGELWRVKAPLRERVQVRPLNLLESFVGLGKFDIIFCRNVLIYFSGDLKGSILRRMHEALRPGGYLILGASESLTHAADRFQIVQCNPGIMYKAV